MRAVDARPSADEFAAAYARGEAQVVWTPLVADLETPVSAYLKLGDGRPYGFLLESVEGGAVRGRYSIIGLKPDLVWRCRGERAEINRARPHRRRASSRWTSRALDALRDLIAECRIELPEGLPPIAAGLFGFLGYDMVRLVERLPDKNPDPLGLPDAVMRPPDPRRDLRPHRGPGDAGHAGLAAPGPAGVARLRAGAGAPGRRGSPTSTAACRHEPRPRPAVAASPVANMTPRRLPGDGRAGEGVHPRRRHLPGRAHAALRGAASTLPPFALYRALRRINPSPFLFYLDFGDFSLVGSSPEILVRLRDGKVTIRPLAGTRRRGATTEPRTRRWPTELLADPKERAEHLMLLDLGRNDVGRVAEIGTVRVTEQMMVEHYSHVMHIVSNVEGKLRARPRRARRARSPASRPARVSRRAQGARHGDHRRARARAARPLRRRASATSTPTAPWTPASRCAPALVKDGTLYVQAGGGVVDDSDPEAEYEETLNKARALIRAAEEAVRFAGGTR